MKLLLHVCCAPCFIYPFKKLMQKGYDVVGFFYNPNIHPFFEYINRKNALVEFDKSDNADIIYPEYSPSDFFHKINFKEKKPERCCHCWHLRLEKTAKFAKEKGFPFFSTTLLVSPYQNQDTLKKIGEDIAKAQGLDFYYEDFRAGFRDAHNEAKAQGLYCQKYCGCIYSEMERYKKP